MSTRLFKTRNIAGWIGTFYLSIRTPSPTLPTPLWKAILCSFCCLHHLRLHPRGPKCCQRLKKRQRPPFIAYWRGRGGRGGGNGTPNFVFTPLTFYFAPLPLVKYCKVALVTGTQKISKKLPGIQFSKVAF